MLNDQTLQQLKGVLRVFLDESGRLTAYPAKRKTKLFALYYLASNLKKGVTYTERQINQALNAWHVFGDSATLRRELYDYYLLDRDDDCTQYRVTDNLPNLATFVEENI